MKTVLLIIFLFVAKFGYTQTIDALVKATVVAEMNKWKLDSVTVYMNRITMEGDGKTPSTPYGPSEAYYTTYVQAFVTKLFNEFVKAASYTATALKTYKPAEGTLVYNTSTRTFQRYIGGVWKSP